MTKNTVPYLHSDGNIREANGHEIKAFKENFVHAQRTGFKSPDTSGSLCWKPTYHVRKSNIDFNELDSMLQAKAVKNPTKLKMFLDGIMEELKDKPFIELPSSNPFQYRKNLHKASSRYNIPFGFATTDVSVFVYLRD